MNCTACSNEYDKPEIIDGITYFVCSSCGHVFECKASVFVNSDEVIQKIDNAFSDVILEGGIGLLQAQAIDDYLPKEEQDKQRQKDEKLNWKSISFNDLQRYHSSLSFFDAAGMKFHLPAYIIGSIKGELDDPIFHLTILDTYAESKLVTLNLNQKKSIIEYLNWCLTQEEFEYETEDIEKALKEYWQKSPNKKINNDT